MDKKTLIQFLAISVLILAGWGTVYYLKYGRLVPPGFVPQRPAPAALQQQVQPAPPQPAQPAPQGQVQAAPQEQPPAPDAPQPAPAAAPVDLTLANKHLQMTWTSLGASLRSLGLRDERYRAPYYDKQGERPPLTLLREFQPGMLSDTIEKVTFITRPDPQGPSVHVDVPTADLVYRVVEHGPDRIVFEGTVSDGQGNQLLIRKTVSVAPDSYNYDVKLEFRNASAAPYEVAFALRGAAGIEREALATRNLGTRVAVEKGPNDYKIVGRVAAKLDVQDQSPNESSRIAWAAVANHYFAAIMRPEDSEWVESVASDLIVEQDVMQASGRWNTPYLRRITDRRSLAADAAVVINTVPLNLAPGAHADESVQLHRGP